jgi:hypothetical protein
MGIVGQEEENFGHKMVSTKFILKFKGAVKREYAERSNGH